MLPIQNVIEPKIITFANNLITISNDLITTLNGNNRKH